MDLCRVRIGKPSRGFTGRRRKAIKDGDLGVTGFQPVDSLSSDLGSDGGNETEVRQLFLMG